MIIADKKASFNEKFATMTKTRLAGGVNGGVLLTEIDNAGRCRRCGSEGTGRGHATMNAPLLSVDSWEPSMTNRPTDRPTGAIPILIPEMKLRTRREKQFSES